MQAVRRPRRGRVESVDGKLEHDLVVGQVGVADRVVGQKLCTYSLVTPGSLTNEEPTGVTAVSSRVSMIV